MSNRTIIIAGVVVLAILGIAAFIMLRPTTPGTTQNPPNNPFGGSGGNTGTGTTPNQTGLSVTGKDGTAITVPDFTKTNQPSIAGPKTGYQVAGTNVGDFQVLYFPDQSYFLVSLFVEPLGRTRLAAETELRTQLGLSDAQLCQLNLEVHTDAHTNAAYAGGNLGLSFCPGAVPLPN